MAVPAAAASGHTKRSGRLAGAKLSSRRSPQRRADALRKCRWGPSSQHLCSLSRRGSSLPARRRRCYSLTPGHRGRLRSARLLPERARFLPNRSEVPAPSVLAECQQTSCCANRWEGLPCPRPGSPPSGTPSAGPENKAQLSAQVAESKTPQIGHFRKELGSFRSAAAPRSVISVASRPRPRGRWGAGINSLH